MPGRSVSGFAGAEADPKGFMGVAGRAGFAPRAGAITGSAECQRTEDGKQK